VTAFTVFPLISPEICSANAESVRRHSVVECIGQANCQTVTIVTRVIVFRLLQACVSGTRGGDPVFLPVSCSLLRTALPIGGAVEQILPLHEACVFLANSGDHGVEGFGAG